MTEQLQEILNRKPSKWGNLTVKEFERDIKLLQERVEELEEALLQTKYDRDLYIASVEKRERYKQALEKNSNKENEPVSHGKRYE